jgi:hypothetical protein
LNRAKRKTFLKNRTTTRNWCEWVRNNPIIVIENGTIRVFRLDDLQYFEPERYPGKPTKLSKLSKHVPDEIPSRVQFDDEQGLYVPKRGEMAKHAAA